MDVCVQYSPMMVPRSGLARDLLTRLTFGRPMSGGGSRWTSGVNRLCWWAPNVRTSPLTTSLADEGVAGLFADLFQGPHAASPEVRTVQLTIVRPTVALTDLPVNKGTNGFHFDEDSSRGYEGSGCRAGLTRRSRAG